MSKLFRYELRKIFVNRLLIWLLPCLLILNLFLLWYTNTAGENAAPLAAYRQLQVALDALPQEERPVFLAEYCETVEGLGFVERVQAYEARGTEQGQTMAENLKRKDPDAYSKYYKLWLSGDYALFTDNIMQEQTFAAQIKRDMLPLSGYSGYLDGIEQKAATLSGISIFAETASDGFSSRNIQKTAADYAAMHEAEIQFDVPFGVTAATTSLTTDCLAFVFLFVFSFIMLFEEKQRGLFSLIKATPKGRAETMAAKIGVLAGFSAVVILLLYGGNMLLFHFTVGLGDLSRSIQSVAAFMGSTLSLTVGQFLLCYLLLKWLACFLIALVVLLVSVLFKKLPPAFCASAAALLVSFVFYTLIPNNSRVTLLKHMNLFGLFRAENMLGQYLNINVFGFPVSLSGLCVSTTLVLIAAFVPSIILAFQRQRDRQPPRLTITAQKKRAPHTISGKSVLRQELYKILWMNKAAVVLVAFFVLTSVNYMNAALYLTPGELMYKAYMEQLEGPVTQEKLSFLTAEQQRYDDLQRQVEAIDARFTNAEISQTQAEIEAEPLQRQLAGRQVFDRVLQQYDYIRQTPGAQFVYETGYLHLLDTQGGRGGREYLIAVMPLILCLCMVFPMENAAGVENLLAATPRGRGYLTKRKVLISAVMAAIIAIVVQLPNWILTLEAYGLPAFSAPAQSLTVFAQLPGWVSIGTFVLFCAWMKVTACLTGCIAILWISKFARNTIYSLLFTVLVLALPALLLVMGLPWAGYLGLYPVFSAAQFLANGQSILMFVYLELALAAMGFELYFILKREVCKVAQG